jgi:hypothetical protein
MASMDMNGYGYGYVDINYGYQYMYRQTVDRYFTLYCFWTRVETSVEASSLSSIVEEKRGSSEARVWYSSFTEFRGKTAKMTLISRSRILVMIWEIEG